MHAPSVTPENFVYLLLLAVAWAVVLVPPLVQRLMVARPASQRRDPLAALARRQRAPESTVGRYTPHVVPEHTPEPAPTPEPLHPTSAVVAQQRRRLVAAALALLALVTLVLIPTLGPIGVLAHLVADVLLVGFGYLWWRRNQTLDAQTASVVA
ncbi:MAG: hypothetical protein ACR2QE_03795, partial [Acidimicrobiales bacterium]